MPDTSPEKEFTRNRKINADRNDQGNPKNNPAVPEFEIGARVCDPHRLDLQATGCGSPSRAPQIRARPIIQLSLPRCPAISKLCAG
jgi:hypothetical protein